jgi:hypothetical protein
MYDSLANPWPRLGNGSMSNHDNRNYEDEWVHPR